MYNYFRWLNRGGIPIYVGPIISFLRTRFGSTDWFLSTDLDVLLFKREGNLDFFTIELETGQMIGIGIVIETSLSFFNDYVKLSEKKLIKSFPIIIAERDRLQQEIKRNDLRANSIFVMDINRGGDQTLKLKKKK
jgi:hypothetical protein